MANHWTAIASISNLGAQTSHDCELFELGQILVPISYHFCNCDQIGYVYIDILFRRSFYRANVFYIHWTPYSSCPLQCVHK